VREPDPMTVAALDELDPDIFDATTGFLVAE
jgi:hypothetical protein